MGEHVLPSWLLEMFPVDKYTWHIDGAPVLKRDGTPRTHNTVGSVTLPVCPDPHCNKILNDRFENPAKPVIRRVMATEGSVVLGATDVAALGLWLVKTWLLLAHPALRHAEPAIAPETWNLSRKSEDLYRWMIDGEQPPEGLTLWVSRRSAVVDVAVETRHIWLPTVVADGKTIAFEVWCSSLRFLDVTLAYHPGWPIDYPLERERRAVRLWPAPDSADLADLPPVDTRDTAWIDGSEIGFAPGIFPNHNPLPPLSPGTGWFIEPVPGILYVGAPRLSQVCS